MRLVSGQVMNSISQWRQFSMPFNNPYKIDSMIEATGQEIIKRVTENDRLMLTFNMKYTNYDKFGYRMIAMIYEQLSTI